ncbi:MAG TPA: hypothetical protein VKT30_09285 [Caulobacteraceae bacterium]|nr:hypothetical protein [Caulobacteraceae bacterium]
MQDWRGARVSALFGGLLWLAVPGGAVAEATNPAPLGDQAPAAAAQTLAPIAGAPRAPAPPIQPTPPLAPVAPASPAEGAPSTEPPPPPVPVEQQALNPLDLFSTGRETGLGVDFWSGSSAELARAIIPRLVDHPLSPAAAALARRVLASASAAPAGAGSDVDLAAARAQALLALGDAQTAEVILDHTPGLSNSAALSRTAAEAALIDDRDDKACAIESALAVSRDTAFWLRLRSYCEARAGRPSAQLTATLAEQADRDPAFARMMAVILVGGGDPGPPSLRDSIDYAMSRQLKLDLTPALADAPPSIAAHVAAVDDLSAPPPATAPTEAAISAALRAAKTIQAYDTAARLALPGIVQLVQAKAPLANPLQLAAASLAAGDRATAREIRLALADTPAANSDPADLAIIDAALAVAFGRTDEAALDRLTERGARNDPAAARAEAAAAVVYALGWPADGQARVELAGFNLGRSRASPALTLVLDDEADKRVRGDVALLSLSLALESGAAGPGPADRAAIVRALDRAGLASDARAFALEGLIALEAR